MSAAYPRYRLCEWLDTSQESLSRPKPLVYVGIQTKRAPGDPWCHCHDNGEPMLYANTFLAESAIAVLQAKDFLAESAIAALKAQDAAHP